MGRVSDFDSFKIPLAVAIVLTLIFGGFRGRLLLVMMAACLIIGDAIILPRGSVQEFTSDAPDMTDAAIHAVVKQPSVEGAPPLRNLLAISHAEVGKPFTYYFGATWSRSRDFTSDQEWHQYVKHFAERRDAPLQVTVGN